MKCFQSWSTVFVDKIFYVTQTSHKSEMFLSLSKIYVVLNRALADIKNLWKMQSCLAYKFFRENLVNQTTDDFRLTATCKFLMIAGFSIWLKESFPTRSHDFWQNLLSNLVMGFSDKSICLKMRDRIYDKSTRLVKCDRISDK